MGPERALDFDRLRAQARHPRAGDEIKALQHGSELVSHQLRRRHPGRSLEGSTRGHVCLVPSRGKSAEPSGVRGNRLSKRQSDSDQRP